MSIYTDELEEVAKTPQNPHLFKGLKRQTVNEFVQYLKKELPGHANPDMTVVIEPFTTGDLELLAGEFLDGCN